MHRPAWRAGGGSPLPYSSKSTQGRRWTHTESTGQRGRTGTHREGAGHPARELDIQGGSRTPREGVGPQGEQGPQHCWGPPALTQPRSGLPSSQGELSEAKIISACSEICTEPQLSLLMTKGLETTAAPRAKGLKRQRDIQLRKPSAGGVGRRSGHTAFCTPCISQLLSSSATCPTPQRGTCWCGSIPSQPAGGGECPAPRRQSGAVESAVTQPWLSATATAPLRQPPVPTSPARCLPSRTVPISLLLPLCVFVNTTIIQYSWV